MDDNREPSSLPWRVGSSTVIGITGALTRIFMNVFNTQNTHGLDGFLGMLDERANIDKRQRGLITGTQAPGASLGFVP